MINLPERFDAKLKTDQLIDGAVKTYLSIFGQILKDNKLYFFEEYTDHGNEHIEQVLLSSSNLITKETFENILQPKDVGYYILAVLLHDLAMHLHFDGFQALLKGDFDDIRDTEIDKLTWKELWDDFLMEAKKFNRKQLYAIFGDENASIRIPPSDSQEINGFDKKLIGEFVRRHHPRLAQEIIKKGFPGKQLLTVDTQIPIAERNLIGLIARSHGMDLRVALQIVETQFGKHLRRTPYNCHAVYLMVLLRLGDYIQIDSRRTSKILLKTRSLSSPISLMEHSAHLAITAIDDQYQDDPERIYVDADPQDSRMFLKLKNLVSDIQKEFDISWAVLGELYGTIPAKPSIRHRRIISNLEDEQFLQKRKYVADQFSFRANDEIIRLLIAPLYGNEPTYAVRELLQNSLDACSERNLALNEESYQPNIDVTISEKEKGELLFEIKDNGIGMDIHVIRDYLLVAGVSYRKSIKWRKEFLDEQGNSAVRRSGRFGVGLLAAFLLGDEVYVETRKVGSSIGYRFKATLRDPQINVIKDGGIPSGTLIRVKIKNKNTIGKLNPYRQLSYRFVDWYEWYTLKTPVVNYSYLGENIYKTPVRDPDFLDTLPKGWKAIDSPGFNKILWTYSNKYNRAEATCNGIIIPSSGQGLGSPLILKSPKISIFDNNALTPLTLNRNSFSATLPFADELKKDIFKDYLAFLLTRVNIKEPKKSVLLLRQNIKHPASSPDYETFKYGPYHFNETRFQNLNKYLISKKGFVVDYNYFIKKIGVNPLITMQSHDEDVVKSIKFDVKDSFFYFSSSKISSIEEYKDALTPLYGGSPKEDDEEIEDDFFKRLEQDNPATVFMKRTKYDFLFNSSRKRASSWLKRILRVHYETDGWIALKVGTLDYSYITKSFLKNNIQNLNFIRETKTLCYQEGDRLLDDLLERYFGDDVIIPFDLDERKKKFPLAFKELKPYIKVYEQRSYDDSDLNL